MSLTRKEKIEKLDFKISTLKLKLGHSTHQEIRLREWKCKKVKVIRKLRYFKKEIQQLQKIPTDQ